MNIFLWMDVEKFLTISGMIEFLPYIYSGYFFPHKTKGGKVNKWGGAGAYFFLDLAAFSVIIENDVF